MGLTLWLVPSPEDATKLKEFMHDHPSGTKSPSSYPHFDPHITLASLASPLPISVLRSCIPSNEPALTVTFESLDIGDHYFRSVYVAIRLTERLSELHAHIHQKLGVEPRTPLYPHVSLCYIDDSDASEGERLKYVERLDAAGKVSRKEDGVSLKCGDEWMDHFAGSEIWIANCVGPVEEWEILDKIHLK